MSKIRKSQQRKHRERREAKSVHGAVCRKAEAQEANLKASTGWMEGKSLAAVTESKVFAI